MKKFALALAIVACSSTPLHARADDLTPREIYLRSVATMHALPEKAYLQFTYSWSQVVNGTPSSSAVWNMVLRTWNGQTRMDDGSGKVSDRTFDMRPDLLLAHPQSSEAPDDSSFRLGLDVDAAEKLPTIAQVVARPVRYRVTLLDDRTAPGCSDVYHLALEPISDPDRNNVRELWVDKASFKICKAKAVWKAGRYGGRVVPMTFTLSFSDRGFATGWTAAGTIESRSNTATYTAEGTYGDLQQFEASPLADWK